MIDLDKALNYARMRRNDTVAEALIYLHELTEGSDRELTPKERQAQELAQNQQHTVIAKALLCAYKELKRLRRVLYESINGQQMDNLIDANRDELLKKHQEAVSLVQRVVEQSREPNGACTAIGAFGTLYLYQVLTALSKFNPMHAESWDGWPL